MTEDVSAGRLHLEAYVDTTGVTRGLQRKLDAELAKVRGKIRVQIDTKGVVTEARRAAKEATDAARNVRVKLKVELDTKGIVGQAKAAAQEVAKVRASLNVDADTTGALAQVAAARAAIGAMGASIKVKADTTGAVAEAKAATEVIDSMDADISVDADTKGAEAGAKRTTSAFQKTSQQVGSTMMQFSKLPMIVGGIYQLASAAVAAASGLFSMGAASAQAVSTLAVLPNLAGMAVQGLGALVIGFSGVFDAVGALAEAEKSAATDAEDYAAAQTNAARAIRDAQRSLAQARHDAADSAKANAEAIRDAEWSLARAQEGARDAQLDLNEARKQARRDIVEMNRELRNTRLDEAEAIAAVEKAREDLQDVEWSASSSPQELRDATMALAKAENDLLRVQEARADQERDTAAANKAGVAGAKNVLDAKDALRDANHAEKESEEDLAQTRHDAKDAARANAEAIRAAQEALADAHRMARDAADEQTASAKKAADALDGLSPAAQRFARYLVSLKPLWTEFKHSVQEALLPPIQRGIKAALPMLETLRVGMVDTATRVGKGFEELGKMLGSKEWTGDVALIMGENNRALSRFGRATGSLLTMFKDLAVVAGPTLLRPFSKWVEKLTEGWAETVKTKRQTGELKTFFENAAERAAQLGDIVGNLTGALFGLGKGSAGAGGDLLDSFEKTTAGWNEYLNSDAGQERMDKFFQAVKPVTQEVGKLIGNLLEFLALAAESGGGGSIVVFLQAINGVLDGINGAMKNPGVASFVGWAMTIGGLLGAAGMVVGFFVKRLSSLFNTTRRMGKLLWKFGQGIVWVAKLLGGVFMNVLRGVMVAFHLLKVAFMANPIGFIIVAIIAVIAAFVLMYKKVEWFRKAVDKSVGWIVDTFWSIVDAAKGIWDDLFGHSIFPDIADGLEWFAGLVGKVFDGIKAAIKALGKVFKWLWTNAVKPVFKFIRKAIGVAWSLVKGYFNLWKKAVKGLGAAAKWLWEKAIKPAFNGIKKGIKYAWEKVIKPAVDAFWGGLKTIGKWGKWLWDEAIKPAWNRMKRGFTNIWEHAIKPVFDAMVDFVKKTIPNAFTKAVEGIKTIWDGLKKIARKPIEFIVNTVYNRGIRAVVNAIPGVPDLPELSFARGGVLPGYTPGRDVHSFVSPTGGRLNLSGGEGIAVPQVVRALGTRGWDLLNEAGRRGVGAARDALTHLVRGGHNFAKGGIVTVDGEPMSRLAAAQLLVANNVTGLGMRVMQGSYQPYTSYSGTSHMGGGVADTTGGFKEQGALRKVAFAAWARNVAGYPQSNAGSGAHVHAVSRIDPTASGHPQLSSFARGEDGIGGSDYGPNPNPIKSLVDEAVRLSGVLPATISGASDSEDGGWWGKFKAAIGSVKDFASKLPGWFSKLGDMKGWGSMFLDSLKSVLSKAREWINDKVPGPGPFPNVFDKGGAWATGTLGVNLSGRTETVLTNADMVSITASLAELSRNLNKMTTAGSSGVVAPAALVETLNLHAEPNRIPEAIGKVNYELRKIQMGGVHARRAP